METELNELLAKSGLAYEAELEGQFDNANGLHQAAIRALRKFTEKLCSSTEDQEQKRIATRKIDLHRERLETLRQASSGEVHTASVDIPSLALAASDVLLSGQQPTLSFVRDYLFNYRCHLLKLPVERKANATNLRQWPVKFHFHSEQHAARRNLLYPPNDSPILIKTRFQPLLFLHCPRCLRQAYALHPRGVHETQHADPIYEVLPCGGLSYPLHTDSSNSC